MAPSVNAETAVRGLTASWWFGREGFSHLVTFSSVFVGPSTARSARVNDALRVRSVDWLAPAPLSPSDRPRFESGLAVVRRQGRGIPIAASSRSIGLPDPTWPEFGFVSICLAGGNPPFAASTAAILFSQIPLTRHCSKEVAPAVPSVRVPPAPPGEQSSSDPASGAPLCAALRCAA